MDFYNKMIIIKIKYKSMVKKLENKLAKLKNNFNH